MTENDNMDLGPKEGDASRDDSVEQLSGNADRRHSNA